MPILINHVLDPDSKEHSPKGLKANGAVVQVDISLSKTLIKRYGQEGKSIPTPITGLALIDTGASNTCVDEKLIGQLGLSLIRTAPGWTPSGTVQNNIYFVRLNFPELKAVGELSEPNLGVPAQTTVTFERSVVGVNLTGLTAYGKPVVALIGRDLLRIGEFVYCGYGGYFNLSY
jgi:predicted aspartyl protease